MCFSFLHFYYISIRITSNQIFLAVGVLVCVYLFDDETERYHMIDSFYLYKILVLIFHGYCTYSLALAQMKIKYMENIFSQLNYMLNNCHSTDSIQTVNATNTFFLHCFYFAFLCYLSLSIGLEMVLSMMISVSLSHFSILFWLIRCIAYLFSSRIFYSSKNT